jgi:pimeloyl-ACP methyl ester carboxylesterase
MPAHTATKPWSSAFRDQQMEVSGGTQYVRVGGHGPAVLLLHGFGDTGDMWIPLAEDRFYNELSATPASIDEQTRDHYATLCARPGAIHDAFSGQFAAFAQDAIDNQRLVAQGKLALPVLAIGGDHSYGAHLATEIGFAASNVRSAVINNSGHWIMEEQPQQAIAIIVPFLEGKT